MINMSEYQEWRGHPVTQKLLDLLRAGQEQAIEELLANRGEIADYQRGASLAYSEIAHIVRTGESLYGGDND